jgi:hypothetical protein
VVSSIEQSRVEVEDGLFAIKIDFDKQRTNPSKMFLALSSLTDALESTDQTLIKTFNLSIEPITLIEDVQQGSVLVWLRNALQSVDDEAIKDLEVKKVIGSYLVKAKYIIIDFINKRLEIKSIEDIDYLNAELIDEAKATGVNNLAIYSPVNTLDLLSNIQSINDSVGLFDEFTEVNYYLPESGTIPFNKFFNISPKNIEDIATKEIISNQTRLILKIKRPDYLGEAKWEFRHGKKKIEAKISDSEWIEKFRNREINLLPGDSLEADVFCEIRYDHNDEVISEDYCITHVIAIRPMTMSVQHELFSQESLSED